MFLIHGNEETGQHDKYHHERRKARPHAVFEQKEKRQSDNKGYRKTNDLPLRQIEGDFCFYP